MTAAEHFAYTKEQHVFVIMMDMDSYADAIREAPAAREKVPDRRGCPENICTDFSIESKPETQLTREILGVCAGRTPRVLQPGTRVAGGTPRCCSPAASADLTKAVVKMQSQSGKFMVDPTDEGKRG